MQTTQRDNLAGPSNRRDFIKKGATAAATVAAVNSLKTPVYGQSQAPSTGRVIGANDRIVVGFVGVGGQGMAHVRSIKANAGDNKVTLAAVCDVSKYRTAEAKAWVEKDNGGACEGFSDYRKLLEKKDIDAVCVSTVDHWHTRISVDGMNAGKHIYVEKPMARYLPEGFEIYDAVKKTGKILQVGSQGCSDAKWHKAAELCKSGKIGQLVLGQGSYMRNSPKGEWNYPIQGWATADDIDWKSWKGPVVQDRKFSADDYFRWRKYYPYCAGLLGDLFPHRLHPLMLATGNPEFPRRVVCTGTRHIHSDKKTPGTPERDVPEMVAAMTEFPSGYQLMVCSSSVSEQGLRDMIQGQHATLYIGGNRVELKPERPFTEDVDPDTFENLTPGEDIKWHEKNWFECIRSGKQPNAGIDLAIRVQTVIALAEMSERYNAACLFDEKTRKVTTEGGRELPMLNYGSNPLS
ncbi:MAG: Gfo/Idh/MocA family oxidoreductase [Verrucomicrobiales bacterium]|nr:Gfo/Idh/MocA family oxidoreductase [Verrucomicrobiales bacterium]